jgi:hypothetical protein
MTQITRMGSINGHLMRPIRVICVIRGYDYCFSNTRKLLIFSP